MKPKIGQWADAIRAQLRPIEADTLLFGPVVHDDDASYFVLIIGRLGGATDCQQIRGGRGMDRDAVRAARSAMLANLAASRGPPLVLHDFDDELRMVRTAAAIWPQYERIAAGIEVERGGGGQA